MQKQYNKVLSITLRLIVRYNMFPLKEFSLVLLKGVYYLCVYILQYGGMYCIHHLSSPPPTGAATHPSEAGVGG